MTHDDVQARLEYLRGLIQAGSISYGELSELQGLAEHIDPGDVELLEWAGVPEFPDDDDDEDESEACEEVTMTVTFRFIDNGPATTIEVVTDGSTMGRYTALDAEEAYAKAGAELADEFRHRFQRAIEATQTPEEI